MEVRHADRLFHPRQLSRFLQLDDRVVFYPRLQRCDYFGLHVVLDWAAAAARLALKEIRVNSGLSCWSWHCLS
jgi:hypothetical protein